MEALLNCYQQATNDALITVMRSDSREIVLSFRETARRVSHQ
jgi:hypothetical protein